MRIKRAGRIAEDFYVVGYAHMPIYLLDGDSPALFDAGLSALAQIYERETKKVLGKRAPSHLFLTHAHFDHIGAAGHFRNIWPEMQVAGSYRAGKILARPTAIELIKSLNQSAARAIESWGIAPTDNAPFQPFVLDLVLNPDQVIQVGMNYRVEAIYTPGHTWDFMSYWIPDKKILVASEAAGCEEDDGYIHNEFLVDYDVYCNSLQRLARLDAQVLCPGHRIVLTGTDVKEYFRRSLAQAGEYVDMTERMLDEEGGNVGRVVARVKAMEWDPKPWPKQTERAYVMNTETRVRKILERMQTRGEKR